MTKIKNNSQNPRAIIDKTGSVKMLPVGGTIDVDLNDGDLAALKLDKNLSFDGKAKDDAPATDGSSDKLAEIVKLFDDPAVTVDNVVQSVAELLLDKDDGGVALEEALAGLDNANDAHWTQAGKPSLEHLQNVTGNSDLKRAEVDALNVTRKV